MKKTIVALFLALAATTHAQTFKSQYPGAKVADFAYYTAERDTLFLEKGHSMSKLTYTAWEKDSTWKGVSPVVLFVPSETIAFYKRREEFLQRTVPTKTSPRIRRKKNK